jgi:transcriptional regulator with XRE-family HTH domain
MAHDGAGAAGGAAQVLYRLPGLRALRARRLLTQLELARRAGVSKFTIVRLERGGHATARTVRQLAEALGVPPEELGVPVLGAEAAPAGPAPAAAGQPPSRDAGGGGDPAR